VYVRGDLVYKDGEILGEHGSGRFVERTFTATRGLEAKV
jgi:dihydropyrimidinase